MFEGNIGSGSALAHVFEIVGSGGISTDVVGNILTITPSGSAFNWQVVTSADNPVNLVAENGYISKGAGPVQFVLPASASIGDTFKIIGYGNLWTISQNAMQSITIGIKTSTVGVTGSVSATVISDSIDLVCVTANQEFYETSIQGNLMIV